MKIFISGISGTGMGPLALMAKQAGIEVVGSDLHEGAVSEEMRKAGIKFLTDDDLKAERAREGRRKKRSAQDGEFLQKHLSSVDWFVYTSALPTDHPELVLAQKAGVRVSKRDELIAYLVEKLGLKMVAVAGTHGKTTTTSMIVWGCLQLGIPISYLVGTTLPFAEAGSYDSKSEFLVYEADEYDRNFLHFAPWLAVITVATYDHPDIYPTEADYQAAFEKFRGQSEEVIEFRGADALKSAGELRDEGFKLAGEFRLAGEARQKDAALAKAAILRMTEEIGKTITEDEVIAVLDEFPGAGRRFERVTEGVYSDYGHHPEEAAATVEIALEEAELRGLKGVVMIYEPHQNTRQHEVFQGYREAFSGVTKLYWLPTYLTRENPELKVITPEEFVESLELEEGVAEAAETGERLAEELKKWRDEGYLVILMTAGPADAWLRRIFK